MNLPRLIVPATLTVSFGVGGWKLSPTLFRFCESIIPQPKGILFFDDVEAVVFFPVRWALVFALAGALPFLLRFINSRRTTGAPPLGRIRDGVRITALIVLGAAGVAWVRILFMPEQILYNGDWIYFCFWGCGFQTSFAILAVVACIASWALAK